MKRFSHIRAMVICSANKSERLVSDIIKGGGVAYSFPMVSIQSVVDEKIQSFTHPLPRHIIVTSSYAAQYGMQQLKAHIDNDCLNCIKWYAIGHNTAATLANYHQGVIQTPTHTTSEGLFALLKEQRVVTQENYFGIIKGYGGRSFLEQKLLQHGSQVKVLLVYRREPIVYQKDHLLNSLQACSINTIISASYESYFIWSQAILKSLSTFNQLKTVYLLVPSDRIAQKINLSFKRVLVTLTVDNNGFLDQLAIINRLLAK